MAVSDSGTTTSSAPLAVGAGAVVVSAWGLSDAIAKAIDMDGIAWPGTASPCSASSSGSS
jgi:hypothetical protein